MDVLLAIDSLAERKEKLKKAFSELESNQALLSKLGANWKDVDEYLLGVENRLRGDMAMLGSREKAFEAKLRETKEALDKREAEISAREHLSLALVQEKKDEAVAIILERKRKWSEQPNDEDKEEGKGKKEKEKEKSVKGSDKVVKLEEQSRGLDAASGFLAMDVDTTGFPETIQAESRHSDTSMSLSGLLTSVSEVVVVKPRPMLKSLCEAMDSEKLLLFIAEHRKDLNAISAELPFALRSASDPARLVLKALEGYHPPNQNSGSGSSTKNDKLSLPSNKRACIILLEALANPPITNVLSSDDGIAKQPMVSEELKKSAKLIADFWKSKIDLDLDLTSNHSIDAQSLLQLLVTFGLASEYDPDELCKLILPITRRKQTLHLCRSLGLSSKVPDIIERLIKDGKQMEAISFATEFELSDRFPPIPLLKSYLKDARKVVQNAQKSNHNAIAAQNDANQKELSALKVVLKAISDLKIEEKYPPAPLEKRLAQLEKAKADKKRGSGPGKLQQMKKPRTDNKVGGMAQNNKPFYRPPEGRGPYGDPMLLPYNATTNQPSFDRNLIAGYGSTYGISSRSAAVLQNSYMYSSDGAGSLTYGPSSYGVNTTAPSLYNTGYGYGSGLPSAYQSYH